MFDFLVVAVFLALSKLRACRDAALAFVLFQIIYMLVVVPLSYEYYYHGTALINLLLGLATYKHFRLFGSLSFALVPVAYLGYVLCMMRYTPSIYDTIAISITILQAMSLCLRALIQDGHIRGTRGRAFVRMVNFNCFQQGDVLRIIKGKGKGN